MSELWNSDSDFKEKSLNNEPHLGEKKIFQVISKIQIAFGFILAWNIFYSLWVKFLEFKLRGWWAILVDHAQIMNSTLSKNMLFLWFYTLPRVLMVLGAGRGPLVNASLRAAKQADRKLRVYAVEKNPNAVVTYVHLTFVLFIGIWFFFFFFC